MALSVDQVYRDYNTDKVSSSGDRKPPKPEIRALLKQIQNSGGQAVTRNTVASLNGVTPPNENYMGVVLTGAGAGYYYRSGAAWVFGRGFSDTLAFVTLSGSATAQAGVVAAGVDPSQVLEFIATPSTPNTGPMTLTQNGVTQPVLNYAGNPMSAGEWATFVRYRDDGAGNFRLTIDANAAASAAASASAANADKIAGELAADEAQAAASAVSTTQFTSIAAAEAYSPVSAPDFIRTAGYSLAGDGGAALYKKTASEPAHAGKFSITLADAVTVVWYEIAETTVLTKMLGAAADGSTDDTSAIHAAVAYCNTITNPHLIISPGIHQSASTVTIDLPDNSEVTFEGSIRSTATALACRIGKTGTETFRLRAHNIDVWRSAIDTGYTISGVELRNHAFGEFTVRRIYGFGNSGLLTNGTDANGGFSYNQIWLGQLHDNRYNVACIATTPGYNNENIYWGGSYNHSSAWDGAYDTINILVSDYAPSPLNNNRFMLPSLEDNKANARAAQLGGQNNLIFHPRLENPAALTTYDIVLTSSSLRCAVVANSYDVHSTNIIDNGAQNYVETQDSVKRVTQTVSGASINIWQSVASSNAKLFMGRDSGGTERSSLLGDGTFTGLKYLTNAGPGIFTTAGSPEGALSAPIGSIALDTTGGPPWFKNGGGSGNTGWLRLAAA